MIVDLVRGNVRKEDCFTIVDDNQKCEIQVISIADTDTHRVLKYVVKDSNDHDLIPLGAVYTMNMDKTDTTQVLEGELSNRPLSLDDLSRLEYEKRVHTFISTLLVKHGNQQTDIVIAALKAQNFYALVPDKTVRKKINRICNSGRYGNALSAVGGWIALNKEKLASSVKKPSLLSTKKQVSSRVIAEAVTTILKELGYDIVD